MLFDTIFESGTANSVIAEEFKDTTLLEECFIADEISRLPEDKIKESLKNRLLQFKIILL